MEERMMTPEEEAVMNMELFKTEEIFKARVKDVLIELLMNDGQVKMIIENIANNRVQSFKSNLAMNLQNAVSNTY